MKFKDFLMKESDASNIASVDNVIGDKPKNVNKINNLYEDNLTNNIVNALNKSNMKVKLSNPTPFGLQIDFFKPQKEDDILDIISPIIGKNVKIKVKGNSVLIAL